MAPPEPVRIAHAYGNSRAALRRALAADIDMIEVDIWYRGGDVYARHARRLSPLPLLADKRVEPVIDRVFPFDEVGAAHSHMESNAGFGKIVVEID